MLFVVASKVVAAAAAAVVVVVVIVVIIRIVAITTIKKVCLFVFYNCSVDWLLVFCLFRAMIVASMVVCCGYSYCHCYC